MDEQSGARLKRSKSIELEPIESGRMQFVSTLVDLACLSGVTDQPERTDHIHDIAIRGSVSVDTMDLFDVRPSARVLPYGECSLAMAAVGRLSGLTLGPGYRQAVIDIMGRTRGCSHFMTLALELAQIQTLVIYAKLRARLPHGDRSDPEWLRSAPFLENACFALRTESPVMKSVNTDDRETE